MNTLIEEIIKPKARKPKMSKIVQKAILLRELSQASNDVGVVDCLEPVEVKKVETNVAPKCCVGVVVPVITKKAYHCDLCDITFTSPTLFSRHPQTIRHLTKLAANDSSCCKPPE